MDSIAIINGKEQSNISIFNRNFQYGDGLFETCVVKNNQILCAIDAGVLDTGFAAGTPGLNVGGLTPLQLTEILSKANIASKLVGICVSNVAPLLDARGHSQYATAEALLAILGERLFEEIS